MNERPNVFPKGNTEPSAPFTPELATAKTIETPSDYEAKKLIVANEIYDQSIGKDSVVNDAVEQMRQRTEAQIIARNNALANNQNQTNAYQEKFKAAEQRPVFKQPEPEAKKLTELKPSQPRLSKHEEQVALLSQPQFNTPFDVLPLPSEGKLYGLNKKGVKVSYMTAADENILASPNLVNSGEFLEILINRKLLETSIRYKDLHVGDRNAIMIWLRATSYGEMYPVTVFDEDGEPFDTELDLSKLTTKKLGADPDEEGYFDFVLPLSKLPVKFRFLNVGELEEIQKRVEDELEAGALVNQMGTYSLEKQLVEVNGRRDSEYLLKFIEGFRVMDSDALKSYMDEIESGVELELDVRTPRGGSVKTFFPLNPKFFWPKRKS